MVRKSAALLALALVACGPSVRDEAREMLKADLVDPGSAQFRNVEVRLAVVCGEMNAKNRMGGYVGFGKFYADTHSREKGWEQSDRLGGFYDRYHAKCVQPTIDATTAMQKEAAE